MISQDSYIVRSFREGDLDIFYKRFYPRLLFYAQRLLGREMERYAEDCVQNAVFKIWKQKENLNTAMESFQSFKFYFYVAVRNEILNLLRRDIATRHYLELEREKPPASENNIIEHEFRVMLFTAIGNLPEKEKLVFELSYFKGMKNEEIEANTGMSLATVKRYKAKAVKMLAEYIES